MTRSEFERQMTSFRERIADLPAEQRDALMELAHETVERHEQIRRTSLESRRGMERLELALQRMGDACTRWLAIAGDAHRTFERARDQAGPEPGLN
jgi:hypothetical protein